MPILTDWGGNNDERSKKQKKYFTYFKAKIYFLSFSEELPLIHYVSIIDIN